MDKTIVKFDNIDISLLELVEDENELTDEAKASISRNPMVSWAKFILTDDKPNANKQRIPKEEFPNLVKSGIFMPIKMALGQIKEGHEESIPLGVITHLKDLGNQVSGIAALWKKERSDDVDLIKKMFEAGKKPQLSWEIAYSSTKVNDDGIEDLIGTSLRASTIVGMPAYEGRTPMLAIAAKDKNEEESTLEELEILKAKVTELEQTLAQKIKELEDKDTELASLKEYKDTAEKEKADASRILSIKEKFNSAGIEKPEEYFSTNREMLLKLDEASLDFMVQELVAFSNTSNASTEDKPKIPKIPAQRTGKSEVGDILKALRERK